MLQGTLSHLTWNEVGTHTSCKFSSLTLAAARKSDKYENLNLRAMVILILLKSIYIVHVSPNIILEYMCYHNHDTL